MENETGTYEVYIELVNDGKHYGKLFNVEGHLIDGDWVQLIGTETVSFFKAENVAMVRVPNLAPEDEDESI